MNWDNVTWRNLKKGELIKNGDYADVCNDGWRDNSIWKQTTRVGQLAPDPGFPSHAIFRRIVI